VREYEEGTLVLDVVNGSEKDLIWRGTAKKTVDQNATPDKITKTINEAVKKLLKGFPPF